MKDNAHLKGFGRLPSLLIAQGVKPKDAEWFSSFIDKLIRTRGPKGALLYLDSLGNTIGVESIGYASKTENPTWVRRSVISLFKRTKNKHLLRRLTKIKRHIVVSKPTPEQVSKFLDSVRREKADEVSMHYASTFVQRGIESMSSYFPKNRDLKPTSALLSYVKRELSRGLSPDKALSKAVGKVQSDLIALENLGYLGDREIADLIYKSLAPLNRNEVDRLRTSLPLELTKNDPDTIGIVCGTQEPGMKLRVFASPRLIVQCLLDPLKEWLMLTLRAIENDGCFNQESAVSTIASWMNDGAVKYSLDLQNATDRFPAILEYCALYRAPQFSSCMLRLFRFVSEERWQVHPDLVPYFGVDTIKWEVGQPLGTGPSFGAFSLAHHGLVRGLCLWLGVPFSEYVILGDDICIRNEKLALEYKRTMESIGVPISTTKSVVSDKIAEFAGFTILKDSSFRAGKWREVTSESLLSFVTDPGYDYKLVVPPFWVPLIERMKTVPYPYGMGVPDFLSMSIDDRYFYAIDLVEMFVSNLSEAGQSTPGYEGLYSDSRLLRDLFKNTDIIEHIYKEQNAHENEARNKRLLDGDRQQAKIRTLFTLRNPVRTYNPEGSFGRAHWMQLSWMHRASSQGRDQQALDDRSRRKASRFLRAQASMESQHPDIQEAVESLGSLILSIVTSCNDKVVEHMGGYSNFVKAWIQSVPLLEDYYLGSVVEPSVLDLIRDSIMMFPYYGLGDYSHVPTRFISLIRRYGQAKEVLPSFRPPMPHKK